MEVTHLRAPNPGRFTLTGTNTWIVGRDPAYVIDPGPAHRGHIAALAEAVTDRGGLGAIALTHDHHDHAAGVDPLSARLPAPVAAARGDVDLTLRDGDELGPLTVIATPGHTPDHLAFLCEQTCFTGDAVLGTGSVFIAPTPGAMSGYLEALRRLRALDLEQLCPGHGPVIDDPAAWLDTYIAHRLEREERLIAALGDGLRSTNELLRRVWDDAPTALRVAASMTLEAHLAKLDEEGLLPEGVERQRFSWLRRLRVI